MVVAGASVLLVLLFNQGMSLAGCTAAAPLGWIVPLVSVAIIGAAGWALLAQSEKRSFDPDEFATATCGRCGRAVLAEWRMCPYCGAGVPAVPLDGEAPLADD